MRLFERGEEVFVTYEARRADGGRFRNTEVFTVQEGKIVEVEVVHAPIAENVQRGRAGEGPAIIEVRDDRGRARDS